jgi:hypothetical protein
MTEPLADDHQDALSTATTAISSADARSPAALLPPRNEVHVDDSPAMVCYANFCRVTGTPEELILNYGLIAQPVGGATNVEIRQRLIVNYFTAKRLVQALAMSIERHQKAFGVLETDVQKRVTPAARRAAAPG